MSDQQPAMRTENKRPVKWRRCFAYATIVTALAYAMSYFLMYDISSVSAFSSMEKSLDFELSDVYNAVAQRRAERLLSREVVLVSVDSCSRTRIAQVIEAVDFFAPRVMGLDILFNFPAETDGVLLDAIRGCRNLVLPVLIADGELIGSYFYDLLPVTQRYAAINLAAASVRNVVRDFHPFFPVADSLVHSLTAEVACLAAPHAYRTLVARGNETEVIRYPSVEFPVVAAAEILTPEGELRPEAAPLLEGKIALIGNLYDWTDEHLTPVETISGLEIHAHALQTVLDERYIDLVPTPGSWVMAIVIGFAFAFFGAWLKDRELKGDSLALRVAQILLILLFLRIGCGWFVGYGDYVDFAPSMLMIGLGMLALDLWMGIIDIWEFSTRKNKQQQNDNA